MSERQAQQATTTMHVSAFCWWLTHGPRQVMTRCWRASRGARGVIGYVASVVVLTAVMLSQPDVAAQGSAPEGLAILWVPVLVCVVGAVGMAVDGWRLGRLRRRLIREGRL